MRLGFVIFGLLCGAQVARADAPAAQLTLGAGLDGTAPLAVLDGRVDGAWRGEATHVRLGLGAHARWRDGGFVRDDWNDAADLAQVLRYLEADTTRGEVSLALAAGRLAGVDLGRLLGGYTAAILGERSPVGVAAAAVSASGRLDVVVDDVTGPVALGAAGQRRVADRVFALAAIAVDVGGDAWMPSGRTDAEVGAELEVAERVRVGAAVVGSTRGGGAVVADARWRRRGPAVEFVGSVEVRAGVGAGAHAPWSPLYRLERERMPAADRAGLGAAMALAVIAPAVGELAGEVRRRADLGWTGHARLLLGAREPAQLGAFVAADAEALAVAAEVRARWSRYGISRLEATRHWEREPGGTLVPRWQLLAWFGTALGW